MYFVISSVITASLSCEGHFISEKKQPRIQFCDKLHFQEGLQIADLSNLNTSGNTQSYSVSEGILFRISMFGWFSLDRKVRKILI